MKQKRKKRGPFIVIGSREVYKNPWIRVREDRIIKPDSKKGIYTVLETKGGVSVLPIDKNRNCYLVREYSYGVDSYTIGLPAGGIDRGETPLKAAKRECLEETGFISKRWIYLGKVNYFANLLRVPEHLFLALDVKRVSFDTKEEGTKVTRVLFKRVVQMALRGEIYDAQEIAAIFRAEYFLRKKHLKF